MERIEVFARFAEANKLVVEEQRKAFLLLAGKERENGGAGASAARPETVAVRLGLLSPQQAATVAEQVKRSDFRCGDCDWTGAGQELQVLHDHLVCAGCLGARIGVKKLAPYAECEEASSAAAAAAASTNTQLRGRRTESLRSAAAAEEVARAAEAPPRAQAAGKDTRFFMPPSAATAAAQTHDDANDSDHFYHYDHAPAASGAAAAMALEHSALAVGASSSASSSSPSLSVATYATNIYSNPNSSDSRRQLAPSTGYDKVRRKRRLRFWVGSILWLTLFATAAFAVLYFTDTIDIDFEGFFTEKREELFDREHKDGVEPDEFRYFGGHERDSEE